jgi:hypothetical protein
VLVVEVDVLDTEPLEAGVDALPHIFGPATDVHRATSVARDAELRGEHDLITPIRDRPTNEDLVVAVAVHVGGVEERHAQIKCPMNRRAGLIGIGRAVGLGHAHAAEPLHRNHKT